MTFEERVAAVPAERAREKVLELLDRTMTLARGSRIHGEYWLDRAAVWGRVLQEMTK